MLTGERVLKSMINRKLKAEMNLESRGDLREALRYISESFANLSSSQAEVLEYWLEELKQ